MLHRVVGVQLLKRRAYFFRFLSFVDGMGGRNADFEIQMEFVRGICFELVECHFQIIRGIVVSAESAYSIKMQRRDVCAFAKCFQENRFQYRFSFSRPLGCHVRIVVILGWITGIP